ncbi:MULTISPECIES: toll/interleukin-1 receptor domain-containing protein [unclassified Streptomyces]|uniref:Toll/interleukin-1 receptor domain-containing protein n=1 Tax=Streptomyces sp. NBC_00119 TaxID=2975659 RepID=A0AAU1TZP7_9ACTN|nr:MULTISPECIES: toll/interleukin-1 receptor domain-containing protein [unclassified Streptomyces]MCX4641239.1 toll/interleukin-1 receptor domain-containing protein [Streptomyces sp. NBC_01446]MCX5322344.1 toll/interleukin-1 receptor domain-containing protein [Streptomyces sp. NBC_00120]
MDPSAFFYTSCTRGDGWPALTRFHADLEYRLRAQEGYGISGALGAAMNPDTVPSSAITRAGVMIALYSPRYFLDRGCGLEWAVIQSRMRRRANVEGIQVPGCLIPVCWKPVAERLIPQEVRRSESFPGPGAFDWLREQGLEALVSSSDPGADERYYVFVEQLTKSILEAGRAGLAPLGADEARDTLPAFGSAQGAAGPSGPHLRVPEQPAPRHESAAGEPRSVAISYVGADQAWADWMDGVLREEGHTVRQRRRRVGRETLSQAVERARDGADRVVVVFSRSYFDAGNTAPTDWEAAFNPPASDPSWLVAVQIDAAPRPVLVRGVKVLTLEGSGPDQAERLREGVMDTTGTARRDPAGGAR